MILTTAKPWAEIRDALKEWGLKKVVVVACGSCSAQCGTGGSEGLQKIIDHLVEDHFQVIGSLVIHEPCDQRLVRQDLRSLDELSGGKSPSVEPDGYIVASCGMGAQTIAEITQKPTIITTNTLIMGETEQIGVYHQTCVACGQCILNFTSGICPIANCPKGMLNGPCGGMQDGKCEVGHYQFPCVWHQIYTRLKALGKLAYFSMVHPPLNWAQIEENRRSDLRTQRRTYYECPDSN